MSENINNIPNENEFKNVFRNAKKSKLWRGTIDERKKKFIDMHEKLNALYGRNIPIVFTNISERFDAVQGASGNSSYCPHITAPLPILPDIAENMRMDSKLSVITFMQLWMRALGVDNVSAVTLSQDIFKEIFPVSAKKLVCINGLLVKTSDVNNDANNDDINNASERDD